MGKNTPLKNKRDQFVGAKKSPKHIYIIIGVVVLAAVAASVLFIGSKGGKTTAQIDPAEAKYIGRYLPKNYEPAQLTESIKYDKRIDMANISPEVKNGNILINAGDVIKNRIVYFEYTRASDGQVIPMMAYIKPSGKLFTGVSFCPPCQEKRQYFDVDGLLTCGACATKRDAESQVGISGACKLYPFDEITHKLVGDKIQIAEAGLAKWTPQPLDRPVGG